MKAKNASSSAWFITRIAACSPGGIRITSMSMVGKSLYLMQAEAPKKIAHAKPSVATSLAQAAGCAVM